MSIDAEEIIKAFEAIDGRRRKETQEDARKGLDEAIEDTYALEAQKIKDSLKCDFKMQCDAMGTRLGKSVLAYVNEQRDVYLDRVEKKLDAPMGVEYDTCYRRLRDAQSREALIKGITQVLERTRKVIEDWRPRDFSALYRSESIDCVKGLLRLGTIMVCEPEQDEDDSAQDAKSMKERENDEVQASYEEQIDSVFDEVFGDLSDPDPNFKKHIEEVTPRVEALMKAGVEAEERLIDLKRKVAESVAGNTIDCSGIDLFEGTVASSTTIPKEQLFKLLDLIESAFALYEQVVKDNGIFGAFPAGKKSMLFRHGSKRRAADIIMPEAFIPEDGENDDSLEMAIELMTEMGKRRYFGPLDDDFTYFIDLFWYGYAKLAEFMSEATYVDRRELQQYFSDIRDILQPRAYQLGYQMDQDQFEDFNNQIKKLKG